MKVSINQKATQRLRRGHPWIFRSDLTQVESEVAGVADVVSSNGKLLGQALYSPESLIALRVMARGEEKINDSLIRNRMDAAARFREQLFPGSRVYRMIFGEADGLPSLIVDRFEDIFVLQTLSAGMETFKEAVLANLKDSFAAQSIIERNDSPVRQKEGLSLIRQVCFGNDPGEFPVSWGGKKFYVNPLEGQKTGFFLDQRINAQKAAPYLKGRVLDVFSNGGQFSIQGSPGAESIQCVDISDTATGLALKNAELNGISILEAYCQNGFDYLKEQDRKKNRFDSVILDPPAFVKGRASLKNAIRGYKEINLRALRILNPGGILVTFSCSQNLGREEFEKIITEAGRDSRARVQILERLGQAPDHPVLLGFPESDYLKGMLLRVEKDY